MESVFSQKLTLLFKTLISGLSDRNLNQPTQVKKIFHQKRDEGFQSSFQTQKKTVGSRET